MALDVGFSVYEKIKTKGNEVFVRAVEGYDLSVCGRCDATVKFVEWVERRSRECGDKEYPEIVMTDKSLDGIVKNDVNIDYEKHAWSKAKLFYKSIEDLEDVMDIESAKKEHNDYIKRIKSNIKEIENEIGLLRMHQENATTSVAFDGFQALIDDKSYELSCEKGYLEEAIDDDYDYNHAKWIDDVIKEAKNIMKVHPEYIVTAWCSY